MINDRTPFEIYRLVLLKLMHELHLSKVDDFNTLVTKMESNNHYNGTDPSIKFSVNEKVTVIYDIEVLPDFSPVTLSKWIRHASNCSFMFLIVPEHVRLNVEAICTNHIHNCEVKSFVIEKLGPNTEVNINL